MLHIKLSNKAEVSTILNAELRDTRTCTSTTYVKPKPWLQSQWIIWRYLYAVTKRKQARLSRFLELFDLANNLEAGAPSLFETSQLVTIENLDQDVDNEKGVRKLLGVNLLRPKNKNSYNS